MTDQNNGNENRAPIEKLFENWKSYSFEESIEKILDRRIPLTEIQFINYLNRAFQRSEPEDSEVIFWDMDENDEKVMSTYRLVKSIFENFDIDNRYYLFLMDMKPGPHGEIVPDYERGGDRLGELRVYHGGSEYPRYVFSVLHDEAYSIKDYLDKVLDQLQLQESPTRKGNQGRKPSPGSEPAFKIWKKEDDNNLPHVESYNLFVKLNKEANKKEKLYEDSAYKTSKESFNKAMRYQREKEEEGN